MGRRPQVREARRGREGPSDWNDFFWGFRPCRCPHSAETRGSGPGAAAAPPPRTRPTDASGAVRGAGRTPLPTPLDLQAAGGDQAGEAFGWGQLEASAAPWSWQDSATGSGFETGGGHPRPAGPALEAIWEGAATVPADGIQTPEGPHRGLPAKLPLKSGCLSSPPPGSFVNGGFLDPLLGCMIWGAACVSGSTLLLREALLRRLRRVPPHSQGC